MMQELDTLCESSKAGKSLFMPHLQKAAVVCYGNKVEEMLHMLDARPINSFTPFTMNDILKKAAIIETDLGIKQILAVPHKVITINIQNSISVFCG